MTVAAALWTAAEAAAATGGAVTAEWSATGVSIDSRTLRPGDLFTALAGPNFDGHAFVADALDGGAVAAMVARVPDGVRADAPLLTVPNTLEGLEKLGVAGRGRARARIIAVTGSVGKTSVKEALAYVLDRQGVTGFSAGSFNNQFGVPLSLARLDPAADYGVFELGMNHAGELTPLSRMVRPHVAIITTIEPAHMAHFASLADIARAKAEIFAGIEPGGAAVLNRDNAYYDLLAEAARAAGAEAVGFGRHDKAAFRLVEVDADSHGSNVVMSAQGATISYRLPLVGEHWVMNSLAVLAAVAAAGADISRAAKDIAGLAPAARRGERHQVRVGGTCFEVIDDSYNASPAAMAAALKVLGTAQPGPTGRRIAVLGDMLELGDDSPAFHRSLVRSLGDADVDLVFAVGPEMRRLYDALEAPLRGAWTEDSADMAPLVAAEVATGDVIMVKGSAGVGMRRVVDALTGLGARSNRATAGDGGVGRSC